MQRSVWGYEDHLILKAVESASFQAVKLPVSELVHVYHTHTLKNVVFIRGDVLSNALAPSMVYH